MVYLSMENLSLCDRRNKHGNINLRLWILQYICLQVVLIITRNTRSPVVSSGPRRFWILTAENNKKRFLVNKSKIIFSQVQKIPTLAYQIYKTLQIYWVYERDDIKYKYCMIGNEQQKTWQKNTIFTSKMLKGACPC